MRREKILIFPAGMPRSLDFLRKCEQDGRAVIGSSSLAYDPAREQYPAWVHLPYVTDPVFDEALKQAVIERDVAEIYTPNAVVWNYLNQNLGRLLPDVVLANASPVDEVLRGYRDALAKARYFSANQIRLSSDVS